MRFLSVCSGIEAASAAWKPLGWSPVAFSEIEPFPCAVLAHHYPTVPNLGDMTKFKDWPDYAIDLLCGGTPCQSFSVAGLRKGLDDPRGNLMLTFGAIATKYRPKWLVWENVPGVLSSNGGRDFGSFLGMLGQLGYGFAYRICDAQFHGVAQRRRRVFAVGCLGDWRSAAAVLFEQHSLSGHPAPSRKAGKGASAEVVPSLVASGRGVSRTGETRGQDPVVAQCVTTGTGRRYDPETETILPVLPFDTTQITSPANVSNPKAGDPCHPLAAGAHAPAIAFSSKDFGADASLDLAPTLRAMGHNTSHANGGGQMAVAYGFQPCIARNGRGDMGDVVAALNAQSGETGKGDAAPCVAYTTKLHNTTSNNAGKLFEERATCLDANSPPPALLTATQVRRLTPIECERLQGFPDNFTQIPWRKKAAADCPDGPRYKALGNSWAVNCARWIGWRIQVVEGLK